MTNKPEIQRGLSTNDRKQLKNQCYMIYFICCILFILCTIVGVTVYESFFDSNPQAINYKMALTIGLSMLFFSLAVIFLWNRKYYSDIRNNEKIQKIKTLQEKTKINDYYKRTITPKYTFLVENINFTVDKELFDICNTGDKLIFNYASKSKFLLSIEKSNKT